MDPDRLFCEKALALGLATREEVERACAGPGGRERLIRDLRLGPGPQRRIVLALEASHEDTRTWALPGRHPIGGGDTQDQPSTHLRSEGRPIPEARIWQAGPHTVVTAESLGRYEPVEGDPDRSELGHGGIGRVLAVRDRHLGREVAFKELLDPEGTVEAGRSQDGAVDLAGVSAAGVRFLREARVTGQLEHPNIVPVYELGCREDGTLYYTMKLVRGRTLAEVLREAGTLKDRLDLLTRFQDLCHAIAYAHSRGVIHRDIKAANVMVGEFGETLVLDWGLAKVRGLAEEVARGQVPAMPSVTLDGSLLGTPHHMSPEQAVGDLERVDERTDVWALGTVLYELLTGRKPFRGDSTWDVLEEIRTRPVQPPRALDPQVPAELESICLKALQRDLDQRYADARELAAEIEKYLSGARVSAHEYTSWEHLRRFAAKNRAAFLGAAAVFLVILAALGVLSASWARERREKLSAEYHLALAYGEKAATLLEDHAYLESRIYAAAALRHNPVLGGILPPSAGDRTEPLRQALLAQSAAFRAGQAAPFRFQAVLPGEAPVQALAWSPEGRLLATAASDRRIRLWEAASGRILQTLDGPAAVPCALAFAPDGGLLAAADLGGGVRLWELPSGRPLGAWQAHGSDAFGLAFTQDGRGLLSAGAEGEVVLWAPREGRRLLSFRAHGAPVLDLALSPDGGRIATASRDRSARIFDLATGRCLRTLLGHGGVVRAVAFAPDGSALVTASYDRTLAVWDLETGRQRFAAAFDDELMDAAWDPAGRVVAGLCWDHSLRCFHADSGEAVGRVEAHGAPGRALAFAPGGGRLATAGDDRAVRLWAMAEGERAGWDVRQGYLWSLRFLPGDRLLAAGADGAVRVYGTRDGRLKTTLAGPGDIAYDALLAPDGRTVLASGYDRTVRVWDLPSGRLRRTLKGHTGPVRTLALSGDGRLLASGGKDHLVLLWDPATGRLLHRLAGHEGPVRRVALSGDGRLLASTGEDGTLRLWDSATGAALGIPLRRGSLLGGLAFLSQGRLAVGTGEGDILVLDLASSRVLRTLRWHRQAVFALAVSKEGSQLLSAGDDRDVALWDLAEDAPRVVFRARQSIVAVDLSPDGQRVAFGDAHVARLVDAPAPGSRPDPARLLGEAEAAAGLRLEGFALRR